ncbi:MAG: lysophospholipid acyltransferase family protein [Culicoidibacterales bacterium]
MNVLITALMVFGVILGIAVIIFLFCWILAFAFAGPKVPLALKHILVKTMFPVVNYLLGVDIIVHGKENIPNFKGKKGYAIVANHQSMFDILIIGATFPDPVAFVAKKEISKWPFIGIWTKTLGSAFIDRNNLRQSYEAVMVTGANNIKNGLAMTIFPAGTRSRKNEVQDFKPGSFRIATSNQAPILPITLVDGFKAVDASFFKRVKVHVYVHPMMEYSDYEGLSAFAVAKKAQLIVTAPMLTLE